MASSGLGSILGLVDIDTLRQALLDQGYSEAYLDSISMNDMLYALRSTDEGYPISLDDVEERVTTLESTIIEPLNSPTILGGGGDIQLTAGLTDVLVSPHVEWKLSEPSAGKLKQITSQKAIGGAGSSATDELAPFQWRDGSVVEWRAGNHGTLCWDAATNVVSASDVGTTWTDSAGNYITLLHYENGIATWSKRHDAAGSTFNTVAPTGTWTSSGKPSLDFTALVPTYTQHTRWDVRNISQEPWRPGRNPLTRIVIKQECPSHKGIVAYAKSNPGNNMASGEILPGFTLQTITEWRGNTPNIAYVVATITLHETAAVTQWSGLQASKWGKICLPGTTGLVYSSGLVNGAGVYTYAYPANWVSNKPPTALLSADTVLGGVAVGVLSSPQDRSTLPIAEQVSSSDKLYPIAMGGEITTYPVGTVLTVRGFRSITTSAAATQFHIVPDPETDTVFWWAAASAAGIAANPLVNNYLSYNLVVDRTSGITVGKLTPDGVYLSGAGWAEGHLTKPVSIITRSDVLYGTGSPEGVVTAEVGTEYRDTVGTFGAWVWLKKSGSGNTGWKVISGDTGWRDVAYLNGWAAVGAGGQIRRVGQRVRFRMRYRCDATAATETTFYIPSTGFTVPYPEERSITLGWLNAQSRAALNSATQGIPYAIDAGGDGGLRCAIPPGAYSCTAIVEWDTEDSWPTAWPT